jgi:hypothetical protein
MVPPCFGQWPKQNDPRGMTGDLKTERFKHGGEQGGVLETITAAARTDNLVLKAVKVETHRSAKQYVQVLKRDMRRMGFNQSRQCLKRRVTATGPMDALEIGVQVYGSGHGFLPVDVGPMLCHACKREKTLPAGPVTFLSGRA